jgi:hypothetical protein
LSTLFPLPVALALAGLSAAIGWGLLVSYATSNLGNWAFYTRGVSWLLMVGYASLGAAYVRLSDDEGRILILKGLPLVVVTICALQLMLLATNTWIYPLPGYVIALPLSGYANSPNAFSFDTATALLLLVAGRLRGLYEGRSIYYWTSFATVSVATYFTNARTGAVFVFLVAAGDLLLRLSSRWRGRFFLRPAFAAAAIVIALSVVLSVSHLRSQVTVTSMMPGTVAERSAASVLREQYHLQTLFERLIQPQASDLDRWNTITAGLKYWQSHPLFGAGIGAYYESLRRNSVDAQGIHSTFISFLGEMGAFGELALLAALAVIAMQGVNMMRQPANRHWGVLLLGSLSLIVVGGLVQDFFYQRIFWFVFGLAVAAGADETRDPVSDYVYLGGTMCFGLLLVAVAL